MYVLNESVYILALLTPSTPGWDHKVNTFLAIHTKWKCVDRNASKTFDLTHATDLWIHIERSDIEIVHISIFLTKHSVRPLKIIQNIVLLG